MTAAMMPPERLQDVTLAERLAAMASEMDGMGESDVGDLLREAAAALSVRGEPVAWLWLHEGRPIGAMLRQPVDTADMYWARQGYSAAPLYATPPSEG